MWLTQAHSAMIAAKSAALRPLGVTVAQYAALLSVGAGPGSSATDVARACLVSPQAMAITVAGLEKRGLLARADGPARGRARGTVLTEEGRKVLEKADRAAVLIEQRMAGVLARSEREGLQAALRDVAAATDP